MFSKIPISKSNRIHLDFSIKRMTAGRAFSKNRNDSMNKETVDGSCFESQTFVFNQDSINNSKGTINKNYSLSRPDNKLIVFSSSLKNELDKNKIINLSKNCKMKTSRESDNDYISSCEDENNNNNILTRKDNNYDNDIDNDKINEYDEEDTNRIDYRYYPKIPEIESNKDNKYYWLATYDKLMKKSKIIKILNYYTELSSSQKKLNKIFIKDDNESMQKDNNNSIMTNKIKKYNFKEKSMILEGYEIYFLQKYNRPFIRPKKDGHIFIKLYLLSLDQINKIFSYINRLEYKSYVNCLDLIGEKNYFKIINNSNKTIYNYSTIFFLGTFVNINIYLFSHFESSNNNNTNNKTEFNINNLPSSNKLAKLIKILLINFPDFSKEYFIDYLTKVTFNDYNLGNNEKNKELFDHKLKEINSLLLSNNKKSLKLTKRNKYSANSVIKNVIQKIPTYTQSSHNTPNEFNNFSENNNNTSNLNNLDKKTLNNKHTNIEVNNTDFYNHFEKEMNIKPQKSEKYFKKVDINSLIKNQLNNIKISRSNQINTLDNNSQKNKKKVNSISKSIKHISLVYPTKKSLTRYNTNKSSILFNVEEKVFLNKYNKINISNKENNINIMNSNDIALDNLNKFNSNNNHRNNNYNAIFKTDVRLSNKNIRNKNKLNPFYLTKINTNDNNINTNNNNKTRNKNTKKPLRVLSSIRKIISQKMNNIVVGNTNSTNMNNMSSNNNSNVFKKNDFLYNNESNKLYNYNKLVCKTHNNSKNKKSEYITPRKKKVYYYYH